MPTLELKEFELLSKSASKSILLGIVAAGFLVLSMLAFGGLYIVAFALAAWGLVLSIRKHAGTLPTLLNVLVIGLCLIRPLMWPTLMRFSDGKRPWSTLSFEELSIPHEKQTSTVKSVPAKGQPMPMATVALGQPIDTLDIDPVTLQIVAGIGGDASNRPSWAILNGRTWNISRRVAVGEPNLSFMQVVLGPTGSWLVTGEPTGAITLWDNGSTVGVHALSRSDSVWSGPRGWISALAMASPKHILVSGSVDDCVYLWDVTDPAHLHQVGHLPKQVQGLSSIAVDPTGVLLAVGARDGSVSLWSIKSPRHPELLSNSDTHQGVVHAVVFHPTAPLLATAGDDHRIGLWKISPLKGLLPQCILDSSLPAMLTVDFSPDGRLLAAGGFDGKIRVWDLQNTVSPRLVGVIPGPDVKVQIVRFMPDSKAIIAGYDDGNVRVWSIP